MHNISCCDSCLSCYKLVTKTADPRPKRVLVPPHRESQGGFGELSVRENASVTALERWRRFLTLVDPRGVVSGGVASDLEVGVGEVGVL